MLVLFAANVHIGTSVVCPQSESELCQPILAQDLWMMDHLQMKARALMVILLGIARHHILEGNREIAEPFDQALSLTFCSPSNKKCSGKMSDS